MGIGKSKLGILGGSKLEKERLAELKRVEKMEQEAKKLKNKDPEDNYFIYLITLEEELCRKLAQKLNEPMYNSYLHYHTYFNDGMIDNYEPFRDIQI